LMEELLSFVAGGSDSVSDNPCSRRRAKIPRLTGSHARPSWYRCCNWNATKIHWTRWSCRTKRRHAAPVRCRLPSNHCVTCTRPLQPAPRWRSTLRG
jgi:hypothetical protein